MIGSTNLNLVDSTTLKDVFILKSHPQFQWTSSKCQGMLVGYCSRALQLLTGHLRATLFGWFSKIWSMNSSFEKYWVLHSLHINLTVFCVAWGRSLRFTHEELRSLISSFSMLSWVTSFEFRLSPFLQSKLIIRDLAVWLSGGKTSSSLSWLRLIQNIEKD